MIPAIFALLSITLGDGHYKNGFFEHDDPIKIIRHHVVEESWEEESVELTKNHIKEMHRLKHQGTRVFHELTKASKSRTGNDELIDSLVHQILLIEDKQNENWIGSRFDLSRKMAAEEFHKIMESTKTLDKIRAENEKAKETSSTKRSRYFEMLEQLISDNLEDQASKEVMLKELAKYKTTALDALTLLDDVKYHKDPRLDNHHATRKELTQFSHDILNYDKQVLEAYLAFHKRLAEASTDKEWHEMEKFMNKTLGK